MLRSKKSFILASGSPRRQEFFKDLGLDFTILLPTIPTDESLDSRQSPVENVEVIARRKAHAVLKEYKKECHDKILVTGDTIVVLDNGEILGKPSSKDEAFLMLEKLSGTRHEVISAVCILLVQDNTIIEKTFHDRSFVYFADWKKEILRQYADSGEGLDKAGAYGIQGKGAFLVEKIEGSWATVVGFPMHRFVEELEKLDLLLF